MLCGVQFDEASAHDRRSPLAWSRRPQKANALIDSLSTYFVDNTQQQPVCACRVRGQADESETDQKRVGGRSYRQAKSGVQRFPLGRRKSFDLVEHRSHQPVHRGKTESTSDSTPVTRKTVKPLACSIA
jgi:hypothetical protein